jgi:hypothetical protein
LNFERGVRLRRLSLATTIGMLGGVYAKVKSEL